MSHNFTGERESRFPMLQSVLRDDYLLGELNYLERLLDPALNIPLNPLDRVCASTRMEEGTDNSHYDAVWVRDSLWAYLGLKARRPYEATRVLREMIEYFATPAQRARLDRIIREPQVALAAGGAMEVPHIRFDGRSEDFSDVQHDGRDQIWNHKQNDALALFALCVGEALRDHSILVEDIDDRAWEFLLRLPTYWEKVQFDQMEDAGAWEEIERINTSSIALVTASLEVWWALTQKALWPELLLRQASRLKLDVEKETLFHPRMKTLVDKGYARLAKQLPFESPDYPRESTKYREADAALLNLIFPCSLQRLETSQKRRVLEVVLRLERERGILRYEGDAYQSGNYWLKPTDAGETNPLTDDHSTEAAFTDRARQFIPGTEAQWFFDSWLSQCYGILYAQTGLEADYHRQVHHFNRALGQITAPGMLGADGRPVPEFALPESYNTLVEGQTRRLVPSPITPLNWSKACLALSLTALKQSVRLRQRG